MNRLTYSLLKPNKRTPFYRLRYRTAGEFRWRSKSLGVRNKDVAEKMQIEFIEEYEKEAGGITPPKVQLMAAKLTFACLSMNTSPSPGTAGKRKVRRQRAASYPHSGRTLWMADHL